MLVRTYTEFLLHLQGLAQFFPHLLVRAAGEPALLQMLLQFVPVIKDSVDSHEKKTTHTMKLIITPSACLWGQGMMFLRQRLCVSAVRPMPM